MALHMMTTTDHLDIQVRRKRLGLTQTEVGQMLGGVRTGAISDFEKRGKPLPGGLTRQDVERLLDTYEAGLRRQERGR